METTFSFPGAPAFPCHVPLGWIDDRVECRAYGGTCWISAGGPIARDAFAKIARYAVARGVAAPTPTLVKFASGAASTTAPRPRRVEDPVRVHAYLGPFTSLESDRDVDIIREVGHVAYVMPFDGNFVTDDDVDEKTTEFRRILRARDVKIVERRDAFFVTVDTSTPDAFSRRNEIVFFL